MVKSWWGSYSKFVEESEQSFQNRLLIAVNKQAKAIFKYLNRVHIERLCSIIYVFNNEEIKENLAVHRRKSISFFTTQIRNKYKSLKYIHSFAQKARMTGDEAYYE